MPGMEVGPVHHGSTRQHDLWRVLSLVMGLDGGRKCVWLEREVSISHSWLWLEYLFTFMDKKKLNIDRKDVIVCGGLTSWRWLRSLRGGVQTHEACTFLTLTCIKTTPALYCLSFSWHSHLLFQLFQVWRSGFVLAWKDGFWRVAQPPHLPLKFLR